MNPDVPFDPRTEAPLLSAYVDGELDAANVARIETHLADHPETRAEVDQLRRLTQLTGAMRLKLAPPEDWEVFWKSVYNRTERSLGWIFFVLGAAILGGWIVWESLQALYETDDLPLLVKGGVILGVAGVLVLLVSIIRERVYKRSRTRYKDVIR